MSTRLDDLKLQAEMLSDAYTVSTVSPCVVAAFASDVVEALTELVLFGDLS